MFLPFQPHAKKFFVSRLRSLKTSGFCIYVSLCLKQLDFVLVAYQAVGNSRAFKQQDMGNMHGVVLHKT